WSPPQLRHRFQPPHDVLGVGRRAEHLVRDGEEQVAVGDEQFVAHAEETMSVAVASGGRPQAAENSCEWMPSATLVRAEEFMNPILAVSSTSAGAPSSSSSAADISSVTVGGVWLIASAYSITFRSNGVKAPDFRHRGTSRALAASSPLLCAMK